MVQTWLLHSADCIVFCQPASGGKYIMRKKSITLLVCVYAALCISYTVVSSAMVPHSEEIWQTASQVSTDPSSQSSSSDTSSPTLKEKASVSEKKYCHRYILFCFESYQEINLKTEDRPVYPL